MKTFSWIAALALLVHVLGCASVSSTYDREIERTPASNKPVPEGKLMADGLVFHFPN